MSNSTEPRVDAMIIISSTVRELFDVENAAGDEIELLAPTVGVEGAIDDTAVDWKMDSLEEDLSKATVGRAIDVTVGGMAEETAKLEGTELSVLLTASIVDKTVVGSMTTVMVVTPLYWWQKPPLMIEVRMV